MLEWIEHLGNWRGHLPRRGPGHGPGLLAANVIRYTRTHWQDGDDGIQRRGHDEHYWAAFTTGERLPGEYATADEAKAAAEAHLTASEGDVTRSAPHQPRRTSGGLP